jgi:antitoxin (DNA-binding transcriptional repressor) of toxin-antitoxin stability system
LSRELIFLQKIQRNKIKTDLKFIKKTMTQITLSELPESLQTLLNLAQKTGETLTIIQDGTPLAIISPIKQKKRASFGVMKNSTEIIGDLVEPTSELVSWEATE